MTHKVHPKAFRIKRIEDFNVRGFYCKKMAEYLEEDFLIKDFLNKKFAEASISNIYVDHSANKLSIVIETARPGLIIGRGGEGVEKLKEAIEKIVGSGKKSAIAKVAAQKQQKREIKLDVKEIKNPWTCAMLIAQMSAQQIEKRIPFRQVLKRNIERIMQNKEVKGVRMEVSGRLNGIEIARREWLTQGRMPRQTIRADIDYAQGQAYCTYGVIGIKVWLYRGDKFN